MADGSVPIVLSPEPFSRAVAYLEQPAGRTLRGALVDAVRAGSISADDLNRTVVYVDGVRLGRDETLGHVLQEGQVVNIVVEPLGGGGGRKEIGQILMTIAVIAVAVWVGGPAGVGLGLKSTMLAQVASAAVLTLGQAAVAALFAPDAESKAKANERYALQTASNQYRPWAPFPMAIGEVVCAPDFAAKTFTQAIGDDVWIYGILGLHYGPCVVDELKIGDTLVSSMGDGDFRMEEHLAPGARTFSIYPNDTDQLDLQEELEATTGEATAVIRAGSAEGEQFDFDFFLPGGLHFQKDDGRVIAASVTLTVRYRPVDEAGVPTGPGTWEAGLTIPLTSTTKEPWRVTRSLALPLGRYEFEFKRSLKPDANEKRRDDVGLTAIRAIAFRKPVADETLSVIEFAVRATALNQGTLAPITCRLTPVCEIWDGAAWAEPEATSNPAALTRWLLTGPAPARPLQPEEADVRLRAWSDLCEEYDWKVGIYLTDDRRQADALGMIEQAGRASLWWDGTQIVASAWVEKPAPRQLFTGSNLKDHRWTIVYPEPVHALRVEFANIDEAGDPDELFVYADGYAELADEGEGLEAATLVEGLRLEGQKTPERAYRDGRWELGARLHRRRVDTWTSDVEHLVSSYGDRVRLAWQRVEGATSSRVRCRRWTGELVTGLRLAQPVEMVPGESYAVDIRLTTEVVVAVAIINPADDEPVVTREIEFAVPREPGSSPKRDDLVAFGVPTRISEDTEIIGIEPGEGWAASITGVRYVAPLLMAGETGPIPPLQTRLTRQRSASPPSPTLLGVQNDPSGVRVSFVMPPWAGSPISGFAARWRPTPAEGEDSGWMTLPALAATATTLVTPPPRALPIAAGEAEGATFVDIEVRALTEAGLSSPDPLLVEAIEVREDPFTPLGLTVTPATRVSPGGSSHGVLVVSVDPLGAAQGVEVVLEVRRAPLVGAPDDWESAGLPLSAANPVGDILGLRSGERYGVRAAWRSAGGWLSLWTDEELATVPAGSSVSDDTVNVGGLPSLDLLAALDSFEGAIDDAEEAIAAVADDLEAVEAALSAATAAVDVRVSAARAALAQATQRLYAEIGRAKVGILSEQTIRVAEMSVQITRIDGLLVRMDDAEDGIIAAEALIATLESVTIDLENPSSLASQLEIISAALDSVEGDLLAQISTIEETLVELDADLTDLAGDVVILDGGLIAAVADIDDLDGQMVAVTGRTDVLEAAVEDLEDGAASTAAGLTTVQQVVSTQGAAGVYRAQYGFARSARGKVATLSETLIRITETTAVYEALDLVELTVTGEIDDLGGDLVTLTGVVGSHTTLIADLDAEKVEVSVFNILSAMVTGIAGDVGDLEDALDAVDGRLTTAEGTISSHTTLITGLGIDLSNLGEDVTLLALDVADHDDRLDDAEGETAAIATQVDLIEVSVDTLEGRADDADDAIDGLDGRQTASEAGLLTVTQAAATQTAAGVYRAQHAYARTARGRASVLAEELIRITETTAVYTALDAVELELGDDITDLSATVGEHTEAILDLEEGKAEASVVTTLIASVDTLEGRADDTEDAVDDLDYRQTASEAGLATVTEAAATQTAASLYRAQHGFARTARGRAAVLAEQSVRVTETGAIATSVDALGVEFDDLSADVSVVAGAVVDVEAQLQAAFFEIIAAAGGDPAHLAIKADASGSMIALSATALFLKSVVGDEIIEALKIVGGEAYFGAPISVDVAGRRFSIGPGFGVGGSEVMLWFGPSTTALADMSRTNGYYSFGTDGAMYKGTAALGALANRNDIDASYVINEGITKEWRLDSQAVVSFVSSGAMTTRTTIFSMTLTASGKKITFDGKYLLNARHSQDAWNLYVVVERLAGAVTTDVFTSKRGALAISGDGYISDWQHISFTDTPPAGSTVYTVRVYHDYTIGSPGAFVDYGVSNKILAAREHKTES